MDSVRKLIKNGTLLTPEAYNFLRERKPIRKNIINKIEKREKTVINLNYLESLFEEKDRGRKIKMLDSFSDDIPQGGELENFVQYFNSRYDSLRSLLMKRMSSNKIISIRRASKIDERDNVSLIAMVTEKRKTRSGHLMITLEDPTGKEQGIVLKRKEIFEKAKDLVLDEVVGIKGTASGDGTIFIDQIYFPEIPMKKERNISRTEKEEYALFISDTHVGSPNFLEDKFKEFLKWLKGENSHEEVEKIRYLFFLGDLIDGVGVYPGQKERLEIRDIQKQYEHFAELIKEIPQRIKIIITPGNHDGVRLAEPQPPLYKDLAEPVYELPNVMVTSNPGWIQIKASPNPMKVLLYHGGSFDYYISQVPSLREGGYERPDQIMKFLLKRRHVAPTHATSKGSPMIAPTDQDHLIIDKIPDIFATGHIHKTSASEYRGVLTLCCSSWQSRTPFQVKKGHVPEPCRAILVNLRTREPKILKFT